MSYICARLGYCLQKAECESELEGQENIKKKSKLWKWTMRFVDKHGEQMLKMQMGYNNFHMPYNGGLNRKKFIQLILHFTDFLRSLRRSI